MSKIQSYLPDALMIVGAFAISYGTFEIYNPAGYIVLGVFGLAAGVLAAKADK